MRTTLFRGALALMVLLTMSVAPALAQSLVKGKVVDAQGNPVDGAVVTFEQQGGSAKRDTKTDKKGEFLQVGLQSGSWKVTATKDGVGTATQTGNVTQGRPVELSFKLAPLAQPLVVVIRKRPRNSAPSRQRPPLPRLRATGTKPSPSSTSSSGKS